MKKHFLKSIIVIASMLLFVEVYYFLFNGFVKGFFEAEIKKGAILKTLLFLREIPFLIGFIIYLFFRKRINLNWRFSIVIFLLGYLILRLIW